MEKTQTNNNSGPAPRPNRPMGGHRSGGNRSAGPGGPGDTAGSGGFRGRRPGGRPAPRERVKPEFDQKMVEIRRVARVVSGGRRFSFSVTMVIGNRKGRVGVGIGKGGNTALAIEKAVNNAKRNMITVPLSKTGSIRHEVSAGYGSSQVFLRPAPSRGLIAGSAVRTICVLGGIKDINAKINTRSKNKLNIAKATIDALRQLKGFDGVNKK